MEPDQHSGPEHGPGDRATDPGTGLSPEAPDTHDAMPAGGEVEGAVTGPAEPAVPESGPSVRTDVIMSKLPHTRPQRITGRRHREQARQAPRPSREATAASKEASPTPRGAKRTPAARSTTARPKSRAGTAARAATQPKRGTGGARTTPAPSARPSHRRNAPGLPRLAVDGAVEAAKLPLRVGGRLTLRALDAAARSLRGH